MVRDLLRLTTAKHLKIITLQHILTFSMWSQLNLRVIFGRFSKIVGFTKLFRLVNPLTKMDVKESHRKQRTLAEIKRGASEDSFVNHLLVKLISSLKIIIIIIKPTQRAM